MFSVVNATLLHPLPYPPEQLVSIQDDLTGSGVRDVGMSQPEWQDLQHSGIFDYVSPEWFDENNLTGSSQPARVNLMIVAPDYFALLGVKPELGRIFVVNEDLLRKSLNNLGAAYLRKGYMKAKVRATPTFDEAAHTVAYDIDVVPGALYYLRNLEFKNLSEPQIRQVNAVWKLKSGDVYDPTYAPGFLVNNRQSLRSLDGWSAVWTQRIDDEQKVVDLTLTFRPGGALQ